MQYSSPLISSKLRAELATYVRQLCKISDRAHVQNLTGRELQDNDRKKEGVYRSDWEGGRNNNKHTEQGNELRARPALYLHQSVDRHRPCIHSKASGQCQ